MRARHHGTFKGKLIRLVLRDGRVIETRFRDGRSKTVVTDAGRFRMQDVVRLDFRLATGHRGGQ